MDTDVLKSFVMLAEIGHMTRTASRRHLTQPALSAQIKRLEEDVDQTLFDRGPKGMALTEAGRVFLIHARGVLAQLERGREALRELSGLERGAFSIGGGATATTYLLPPLLGRFHSDFPEVHTFIREQGSARTLEAVLSGALDLGVVTLPVGGALGRSIQKQLQMDLWVEDELRLILPPGHPHGGQSEFEWSMLESEPLVLFTAGTAVREVLDTHFDAAGLEPRIKMELRSIESIKQMVAQGIGAGFVSRFALSNPHTGLTSQTGPIRRQLAVVRRRGRTLGRAAQTFLNRMMTDQGLA